MGAAVLLQGSGIVPAPAISSEPLPLAKELSSAAVGRGQPFAYDIPPEQPGPYARGLPPAPPPAPAPLPAAPPIAPAPAARPLPLLLPAPPAPAPAPLPVSPFSAPAPAARTLPLLLLAPPPPPFARLVAPAPAARPPPLMLPAPPPAPFQGAPLFAPVPAAVPPPPLPAPARVPRTTLYRKRKAAEAAGAGQWQGLPPEGRPRQYACSKCGQPKRMETGHTRIGGVSYCATAGGKSVEEWAQLMKQHKGGGES